MARFLGFLGALGLHLGVILFGGIFFLDAEGEDERLQEVELLTEVDDPEKQQQEPEPPEEPPEIETPPEEIPDAAEIVPELGAPPIAGEPALDAASLSAIEAALEGAGGGGDFASSFDFASGGRLGAPGGGGIDASMESAFSLAEIDQKPTAVFQAQPLYPAEMRGKQVEGRVTLIFIVDASGKVTHPKVVKFSHDAFVKPAVDALKQWKFEPGLMGGKRAACSMSVQICFQPS